MEGSRPATEAGSKTWADNSRVTLLFPSLSNVKTSMKTLFRWELTTRNQRTIPSRSNTRNSLITMSFRCICIWITKQILASILENLCHAIPSQQKHHYAAKQVTSQSTGISNSANKIISANNHPPVSLIFLFSVLALPPLGFFSYYLIHILSPPYFALVIPLWPFFSLPLWLPLCFTNNFN